MKRFLLLPLILLSACGAPVVPETKPPIAVDNISGTINGANGGTIHLIASDNQYFGSKSNITADGRFNIELPAPEEARLYDAPKSFALLNDFCTITSPINASNSHAKALGITSAKINEEKSPYYAAVGNNNGLFRNVKLVTWIYATAPTEMTGTIDCAKLTQGKIASVPVDIKVNLLKGWNPITLNININILQVKASGEFLNSGDYKEQWITTNTLINHLKKLF